MRNNPALIRQYLRDFERRFVWIGDRVACRRADGVAVSLTREEAADLIAGMRATLSEADAANPWGAGRIFPALFAAPMLLIIAGAIVDMLVAALAFILPTLIAMLLLGPVLGAVRIHLAWGRGTAAAEAALAAHEAIDSGTLPVNRARSAFAVVAVLAAALILGLMIAALSALAYARADVDRVLGVLILPVVLVVVAFAWISAAVDARAARVSEAEIADARKTRRNRPLF